MILTLELTLTRLKKMARFAIQNTRTFAGFWYSLSTLMEWLGNATGSIHFLERALKAADQSNSTRAFGIRQRWQFHLERERHAIGRNSAHDPLFECRITPDESARRTRTERRKAPGHFEARLTYRGLRVDGYLGYEQKRTTIRLFLDGQLLREISPSKARITPFFFKLTLQREVLALFPKRAHLSLQLADGSGLLSDGCERVVVEIPHGSGDLSWNQPAGEAINKKGFLVNHGSKLPAKQAGYFRIYSAARDVFRQQLDNPLFLLYGTLLGVHRGGDLIPGDDDFDVGYLCPATDVSAMKAHTIAVVLTLVRAGFWVSFNRYGRLFRLRLPGDPPDIHLDVHPVWFENGSTWIHPRAQLNCAPEDFVPTQVRTVRGTTVDVPGKPEAFLAAYYGADWRTPNPAYSTASRPTTRQMMGHLAKAFITPREYATMQAELARFQGSAACPGKLISIGSHSLYPLDQFEVDCGW